MLNLDKFDWKEDPATLWYTGIRYECDINDFTLDKEILNVLTFSADSCGNLLSGYINYNDEIYEIVLISHYEDDEEALPDLKNQLHEICTRHHLKESSIKIDIN